MRVIKVIFEKSEQDDEKRFGYIINPTNKTYSTVHFDARYEATKTFESKPIGDLTIFGQKIWRVIRAALTSSK
jgi:hypothetical protein